MWANHDWNNIFPFKRSANHSLLQSGRTPEPTFEAATEHMIRNYFGHPSYWRVDGGLYVSVYELMGLIQSLGGLEKAREVLDRFRKRTRDADYGELRLNAVVWGIQNLPGEKILENPARMVDILGFDSVTSYVWVHNVPMDEYPTVEYANYAGKAIKDWYKFRDLYSVPYFPNVSMGWDSSPRTVQTDVHADLGYPFTPILVGNTPEAFHNALQTAKSFLEEGYTEPPVLTINSWNEWTEGSYLEPDTVTGYQYLEGIRKVFGSSHIEHKESDSQA